MNTQQQWTQAGMSNTQANTAYQGEQQRKQGRVENYKSYYVLGPMNQTQQLKATGNFN